MRIAGIGLFLITIMTACVDRCDIVRYDIPKFCYFSRGTDTLYYRDFSGISNPTTPTPQKVIDSFKYLKAIGYELFVIYPTTFEYADCDLCEGSNKLSPSNYCKKIK